MPIWVGCCGFSVKRARYYEHFPVVEVQQTFYQPPRETTLRRWREEAPPTFHFAIKAWQLITHPPTSPTYRRLRTPLTGEKEAYGFFRPTKEVWAAWEVTAHAATVLNARWIIFQCPPSFTPTEEHITYLRDFFQRLPRGPWRLGWEPRGAWPRDIVAMLCEELSLVHVVDPFQQQPVTRGVAYFRLHGKGGYRYQYTEEDLRSLYAMCQPFAETWVLFNNAHMWHDAQTFTTLTAIIQE